MSLAMAGVDAHCKHYTSKDRKMAPEILHENNGYGTYSYEKDCGELQHHKKNWNDAYNMQLTKHDTNDDVDTLHLHFNGRVAYMH